MKRPTLTRAGLVLLSMLAVCGTVHAAAPACTLQWDPIFGVPTTPGFAEAIVRAFTEYQGQLIAGGGFPALAGSGFSSVAAWNPATGSWSDMSFRNCNGGPQPVGSLAVWQGDLYAGGVFEWSTSCTGDPCPMELSDKGILARWNPAGAAGHCIPDAEGRVQQIGNWSRVGGAVNGAAVRVLAVFDDGSGEKLYVGGHVPAMAGNPNPDATHLFTWNGNSWGTVGDGVDGETGGSADAPGVWDLLVVPSGSGPAPGLYVAGQFSAALADGRSAVSLTRGIARWDGGFWHAVGGGLDPDTLQCPPASTFVVTPTKGLVGPIGGGEGGGTLPKPVPCVPHVGALELFSDVFGPRLFAGGRFRDVGGLGSPSAMTKELLGGSIAVNNLAVWDGSGWQAVGTPPNDGVVGEVAALEVMEGASSLAVAGQFAIAGGGSVSNVARWDSLGWSSLNGGLDPAGILRCSWDNGNSVKALRSFGAGTDEYLYAGGPFDNASNPPAPAFVAFGSARWGCALTCFGDVDVDGTVGVTDFLAILAAWGSCPPCPAACPADVNGDEVVDGLDLDVVDANWGTCPP